MSTWPCVRVCVCEARTLPERFNSRPPPHRLCIMRFKMPASASALAAAALAAPAAGRHGAAPGRSLLFYTFSGNMSSIKLRARLARPGRGTGAARRRADDVGGGLCVAPPPRPGSLLVNTGTSSSVLPSSFSRRSRLQPCSAAALQLQQAEEASSSRSAGTDAVRRPAPGPGPAQARGAM